MCRARGRNAEKSLSSCRLNKQRLINGLAGGVNERHCWHDDSSPNYRPKFRVFTEKAHGAGLVGHKVVELKHYCYLFVPL